MDPRGGIHRHGVGFETGISLPSVSLAPADFLEDCHLWAAPWAPFGVPGIYVSAGGGSWV